VTYQATWKRGMRIARESAFGTAPSYVNYNEGGKWFSLITTSAPGALRKRQAMIVPVGRVGKRNAHQYEPVPGRRHSEGSLDIPFVADVGGLWLLGALGAVASTPADDAGNPLLADGPIGVSPESLVVTDPTTSAILEVTTTGTTTGTGTLVITGVDADGRTKTESIALSGDGTFYSRRSWTSLTTVVLTHTFSGPGNIEINGVVSVSHLFTQADTQPTFAVEEQGDPAAGVGNSWLYTGQILQSLGIAFDATEDEGLLTFSPTFQGKYPTAGAASTYQQSVHTAFPSWVVSLTKDGSPYNSRVKSMDLTINTGSRIVKASAGSQDPQGVLYGERLIEGQIVIAVEDDEEYQNFIDRDGIALVLTMESPFALDATTFQALTLNLYEVYITEVEDGDREGLQTLTLSFYCREDPVSGIARATLVNSVASYA
jgi:hypothetical protein